MKDIYLIRTLDSHYCKIVFVASAFLGYFLVPKTAFYGYFEILAWIFIFLFALVITCIVRNTKERIVLSRTYGSSILGTIAVAIGLAALQACGLGAPVCGAAVGMGIFSAIFPSFFMNFFTNYALWIFLISIAFQFLALYFMNCFKSWRTQVQ